MAYPPQQQQPLTRQQRFDEQDKANQEFANQQQALRIQQQRADADEENQAIQQQRFQFERQRWPLDLYSAQAQAEAQRANAQFQQQQMAEQLRTAPQREQQNKATLAATEQGTKDAIANAAKAAEIYTYTQGRRLVQEEHDRLANAAAQEALNKSGLAETRAATVERIQQQENARAQEVAARQQRAEQGAIDLNAASIAHTNATTAATKSAANNVILRNYFDSGAITPHQYAYLNTVPLEDQMAYAEDMLAHKIPAVDVTDTAKVKAQMDAVDTNDLTAFIAERGVDPRTNPIAQKAFEAFRAKKADDQMYNKAEEYYKLNPTERNLIFGAHSRLSRYFNEMHQVPSHSYPYMQ